MVLAVGLAIPVSSAFASPADQAQAEADAALEQLNAYQAELDQASGDYQNALQEQLDAEAKVEEAQKQIEEKTTEIQGYQEQLGDRARDMYRSGSTTFLDVILGATSFEDFATTWNILEDLNQDAADAKVAEMQSVYDNLSSEAAALVEQEQAAEDAAQAQAAEEAIESGNIGGGNNSNNNNNNNNNNNSGGGDYVTSGGNSSAVARAYAEIGKPYAWGAVGPNAYDCSGLVSYCLTGSHSRLGTTGTFMNWPRTNNPQPGDICVNDHHCGIYIGNGQMIHAPHSGATVTISAVHSDMIYVVY